MEHRDNSVYEVPTPQGKFVQSHKPGTSWRHPKEEMMALIKIMKCGLGQMEIQNQEEKIFSRCEVWYNTADYMETC